MVKKSKVDFFLEVKDARICLPFLPILSRNQVIVIMIKSKNLFSKIKIVRIGKIDSLQKVDSYMVKIFEGRFLSGDERCSDLFAFLAYSV